MYVEAMVTLTMSKNDTLYTKMKVNKIDSVRLVESFITERRRRSESAPGLKDQVIGVVVLHVIIHFIKKVGVTKKHVQVFGRPLITLC